MKKILSLALALALAFTLTVSAAGEAFDGFIRPKTVQAPHIGVLQVNLTSESCQRNQNQIEIEAAHRGWKLTTIYYEDEANWRDSFLNLVNQGVDAIICTIVSNADAKTDLIAQAREAGIGVYFVDGGIVEGVIADSTMANSVAAMELFYKIGSDHGWSLNLGVIDNGPMFVAQCRTVPVRAVLGDVYTNMVELAYEDISAAAATMGSMLGAQDTINTWLQQYGEELNCVFSYGDNSAMGAAEMIKAWGDETGEKVFCAGIDGGKRVWSYIRDNTPVKYSYAQPFELYVHNVFELIDQLQVKGMTPGDPGCLISYPGAVMYASGTVITQANVPAIGSPIHTAFDYYNADDAEAWYHWVDGPGAYLVEAYAEK